MSTSQKITNLLNRAPLTIQELATELGISRNSAHLQVRKLEAAGIVEQLEPATTKAAGKPAYRYRTTAGNEDSHSSAYKPLLEVLMQTLSTDLPENKRIELLENSGRALARAAGLQPTKDVTADIRQSLKVVNSLGAMAELSSSGKVNTVTCHSCPVATLVHQEPLTCQLVAAFFAEATDRKVSVHCKKNGTVVCGFRFS